VNTSKETLQMSREDWEFVREYRKAPFKNRYLEHLEKEREIDFKKDQI